MAKNILIGIKPGASSMHLLNLAKDLVPAPATVHLATYVTVGTDGDEHRRIGEANAALDEIAATLKSDGYDAKPHVSVAPMSAGGALTGLAAELEVDLLFLGLVKRSRVGKAVIGSDAQTAILGAPCPIVGAHAE